MEAPGLYKTLTCQPRADEAFIRILSRDWQQKNNFKIPFPLYG
jgi:hypothetical protein